MPGRSRGLRGKHDLTLNLATSYSHQRFGGLLEWIGGGDVDADSAPAVKVEQRFLSLLEVLGFALSVVAALQPDQRHVLDQHAAGLQGRYLPAREPDQHETALPRDRSHASGKEIAADLLQDHVGATPVCELEDALLKGLGIGIDGVVCPYLKREGAFLLRAAHRYYPRPQRLGQPHPCAANAPRGPRHEYRLPRL